MSKTFSHVIKAGFLVGTFDIVAALLYYYIKTGNREVFNVLKYVASGFFGKNALTGDALVIVAGLLFHYFIAFVFTALFFWLFPQIKVLSRNKFLTGIVYGCFVWAVMNLAVVPLSRIGSRPFNLLNAFINLLILVLCIGIPLSFMANNFYKNRT
jgi:hypothetical protein